MSTHQTPYRVICPEHGEQYLSYEQYMKQLIQADDTWRCPFPWCNKKAEWDDAWYDLMNEPDEEFLDIEDDGVHDPFGDE